ncbi:hypothetical protein H5410_004122 [Solanum commersonii]|uniref:Uncharacterized protein n=1 Tax=Solanum commersonii TaxID=4109 RepID=A0A9J6B6H8_SOLCO|nr:hypothetical protein H5410_004122 [Solanum commersonii]
MPSGISSLFPQLGKPASASENFPLNSMQKLQAHRCVLLDCAIVTQFVDVDGNLRQEELPYYGKLEDIIEINYNGWFKCVLFKYLFILENVKNMILTPKHLKHIVNKGWSVVVNLKPIDLYDMGEVMEEEVYENEPYQEQELDQFFTDSDEYVQLAIVEVNVATNLATYAMFD